MKTLWNICILFLLAAGSSVFADELLLPSYPSQLIIGYFGNATNKSSPSDIASMIIPIDISVSDAQKPDSRLHASADGGVLVFSPGVYKLQVMYHEGNSKTPYIVTFSAEKGKKYVLSYLGSGAKDLSISITERT